MRHSTRSLYAIAAWHRGLSDFLVTLSSVLVVRNRILLYKQICHSMGVR